MSKELNISVKRKAQAWAHGSEQDRNSGSFIGKMFTGRAVELDHRVTQELTDSGFAITRVLMAPLRIFNELDRHIEARPGMDQIIDRTIEDTIGVIPRMLGIRKRTPKELKKHRQESRAIVDNLIELNEEIRRPNSRARLIDSSGNIVRDRT
jgi:hypothetical protein